MVDTDQKSERVENLVTNMLSDKIETSEIFSIETPSFIINHAVANVSKLQTEINILNKTTFKISSYCDITNDYDCFDKTVVFKVKY